MAFPLVSRSFFVTLSSITASHEVFGCQSLMKNVAIVSLSMYSLLRNGVTLRSRYKTEKTIDILQNAETVCCNIKSYFSFR